MPLNGFSVGHDLAIDIISPLTGQLITNWPLITGFSAEPATKQITSEPLNSYPLYSELPTGWKGTIDFDRTSGVIDNFFAHLEAAYYAGQNTLTGSITQTITEQNGTVSQYQFKGVTFKYTQAGQWKAQDKVAIRLDFVAGTRIKVV